MKSLPYEIKRSQLKSLKHVLLNDFLEKNAMTLIESVMKYEEEF